MTLTESVSARDRQVGFLVLAIIMLVIAVGHLYLIGDFVGISLGLPLWIWLQLAIVAILLALAWFATGLVTGGGGG